MPTIIGQVHYNYHSQVPPSTSSGQHSRTRHNRNQKRERGAPKKGYRRDDTLRSADPRVAPRKTDGTQGGHRRHARLADGAGWGLRAAPATSRYPIATTLRTY